jgi:hypothetical protein
MTVGSMFVLSPAPTQPRCSGPTGFAGLVMNGESWHTENCAQPKVVA